MRGLEIEARRRPFGGVARETVQMRDGLLRSMQYAVPGTDDERQSLQRNDPSRRSMRCPDPKVRRPTGTGIGRYRNIQVQPTEEARAAAYTIPSYEDQYYSPDFGQATGAAVPLDDYGYSDYR